MAEIIDSKEIALVRSLNEILVSSEDRRVILEILNVWEKRGWLGSLLDSQYREKWAAVKKGVIRDELPDSTFINTDVAELPVLLSNRFRGEEWLGELTASRDTLVVSLETYVPDKGFKKADLLVTYQTPSLPKITFFYGG